MRFEEALREIQIKAPLTNDFIMAAREQPTGKVMKRSGWDDEFPIKYLWITQTNCLVYSIGEGMSAPMLMNVNDYLADDWVVMQK